MLLGARIFAGPTEAQPGRVYLGLGGSFLEPYERAVGNGAVPAVTGRPELAFRGSLSLAPAPGLSKAVFEPRLGFLLPELKDGIIFSWTGFSDMNLVYRLEERMLLGAGVGLQFNELNSLRRELQANGTFIEPPGSVLAWCWTVNIVGGYRIDRDFRFDAQISTLRLLDQASRKFRFLVEVGYALF